MKRNIIIKVFLIIMVVLLLLPCNSVSYGFSVNDMVGSGTSKPIEDVGQNVIFILSTAGSIISVIVLVVLGIKYMLGSVEEKAEYKKTLMAYVIGAALVFAASTIAAIIYSIAK